jgi:hypothetical protein
VAESHRQHPLAGCSRWSSGTSWARRHSLRAWSPSKPSYTAAQEISCGAVGAYVLKDRVAARSFALTGGMCLVGREQGRCGSGRSTSCMGRSPHDLLKTRLGAPAGDRREAFASFEDQLAAREGLVAERVVAPRYGPVYWLDQRSVAAPFLGPSANPTDRLAFTLLYP